MLIYCVECPETIVSFGSIDIITCMGNAPVGYVSKQETNLI